jgi:hypothetical protein
VSTRSARRDGQLADRLQALQASGAGHAADLAAIEKMIVKAEAKLAPKARPRGEAAADHGADRP